ncbi:hypothetical protein LSH36_269g12037, partial [Paralvinella palmiformis]
GNCLSTLHRSKTGLIHPSVYRLLTTTPTRCRLNSRDFYTPSSSNKKYEKTSNEQERSTEKHIIQSPIQDYDITESQLLPHYLMENWHKFPNKTALINGETRAKVTHGELQTQTIKLGSAMRRLGFGKGDVMTIISPNCPEFCFVYLAGTAIGMTIKMFRPTGLIQLAVYRLLTTIPTRCRLNLKPFYIPSLTMKRYAKTSNDQERSTETYIIRSPIRDYDIPESQFLPHYLMENWYINGETGAKTSYGELQTQTIKLGSAMRRQIVPSFVSFIWLRTIVLGNASGHQSLAYLLQDDGKDFPE